MKYEIILDGGKYTYQFDNGKQTALRYDEPWRDLCGDNLVFHLAAELHRYREACHGLDIPEGVPPGALAELVAAARAVIDSWERGDLAGDVRHLDATLAPFKTSD